MGIYNTVLFQINCPKCEALINEFQTKEGPGVFDVMKFNEVNNFHAICKNCGSFVEFYYSPENKERSIQDYKMRIIQLKNGK